MEQQTALNIDVTISQTLRDLIADQRRSAVPASRVEEPDRLPAVRPAPQPRPSYTLGWDRVCLRRDGARPLQFEGLPVLMFEGPLQVGKMECRQKVAVYVSKTQETFLSLILEPPQNAASRALHHATLLAPSTSGAAFADWFGKIGGMALLVTPSSLPTDRSLEIQKAFQSITSHCFQIEQAPPERKQT